MAREKTSVSRFLRVGDQIMNLEQISFIRILATKQADVFFAGGKSLLLSENELLVLERYLDLADRQR